MATTVVLTASAGSFSGLAAALRGARIELEEHPLISFEPPAEWSALDAALTSLSRYESIAFTSPRAARAVVGRMEARGLPWPDEPVVWAIGRATANALDSMAESVRVPDLPRNPSMSPATTLGQAMLEAGAKGPVLFPCGETRREELPSILQAHGIEVHEVVCYRTRLASRSVAGAVAARGKVVVVASPSVVELLAAACSPSERPHLVAIGSTTAASALAAGWNPDAIASEPSTAGVAAAITRLLSSGR